MKLLITCLLVYLGFIGVLFFMQRSMMYFPDNTKPRPIPPNAEEIKVRTQDGLGIYGWHFSPEQGYPTILFFHGNAGHHGHRFFKANIFHSKGYGVLLAGYRGYGGNPGRPSEQGFYADGQAYIDWLRARENNVIVYGESIGTGTAVKIAHEYDVDGLILETPFSSIFEIAQKQYFYVPVKYLLKDTFMNIDKIKTITAPKLFLHGHKDFTIPFSSAQELYRAAPEPKAFIEFPEGGHNDLYEHGAARQVLDFLADILQNTVNNDLIEKGE
ncbi:MAG: alpha/beta hydrolase [Alphaproteobacteria bacterium]|nr:alpha/beta hydrolase [Alphaproteobacteria bacterium]